MKTNRAGRITVIEGLVIAGVVALAGAIGFSIFDRAYSRHHAQQQVEKVRQQHTAEYQKNAKPAYNPQAPAAKPTAPIGPEARLVPKPEPSTARQASIANVLNLDSILMARFEGQLGSPTPLDGILSDVGAICIPYAHEVRQSGKIKRDETSYDSSYSGSSYANSVIQAELLFVKSGGKSLKLCYPYPEWFSRGSVKGRYYPLKESLISHTDLIKLQIDTGSCVGNPKPIHADGIIAKQEDVQYVR